MTQDIASQARASSTISSTVKQMANQNWASRPDDERFISLTEMEDHFRYIRANSRGVVVSNKKLTLQPEAGNKLVVYGPNGSGYEPTNWAFGQMASLVQAPAGYLRTLPAEMAADCLNYGLYKRDVEDIGILLSRTDKNEVRAATGPRYGRIWNSDIVGSLVERFGDGVSGQWKVPGEFGRDVTVTKSNTTLFASDRDFFVFLCDEKNRIQWNNRSMARGFFVWNSEVGAATFGLATFLFDFVCCNRLIWGGAEYHELKVRHTASAPDKFLYEMQPALQRYSDSSSANIVKALDDAKAHRLDNVDEFLATRFSRGMVAKLKAVHEMEEQRPIESRYDAVNAVTAYAKGIPYQDQRVELEREAGKLIVLAA